MAARDTRYAGTLSIIDDEGNVVFERDLSMDEIIEALLPKASVVKPVAIPAKERKHASLPAKKSRSESEPAHKEKKPGKTREKVVALRVAGKNVDEIATELGLSRSAIMYHLAKDAGGSMKSWTKKPKKNKRGRFSRQSFNLVKEMLTGNFHTVDSIVAEKGFAPEDVIEIRDSASYEEYAG